MPASEPDHRQKKTRVGQAAAGSSVSQVLAVPTIADPLNQELCNNLDGEIFKEFMHSKDPHGAGLCLYRSFSGTQADDEIASQMISARRGRG
ncbi:hypothetical protein AYJ70_25655 [Pseudomonas monteilii]|jgi:hypothetical protein|uniref:Uncharacterized protein n=3 Tax=Pseudomonas TaxID=286 RepID=A0A7I8E3M5_PSEAI|nr:MULTISPECIES: hypothetical protein [Pseudomonas]OAH55068.1 hypothetical protein AYJ70_25655 [Pseudomonas monteilii]GJB83788.1 hypothetical protein KAM380_082530 [Aeromonas caviae]ATB51873.1 hypothetical protein [Pseudomonas putida]BCL65046.1 hypothetical protein [Pseudomonas aeruginosa]BCL65110.1 hypothetical protein [Pseudomonas aeruginosa]